MDRYTITGMLIIFCVGVFIYIKEQERKE